MYKNIQTKANQNQIYVSIHLFIVLSLFYFTAELKMELLREREMREGLEKQLQEEQKNKGTCNLV